jgi:hypothetical protein
VLQLPAAANGADNDGESGGAGRGGPAAGGRAAAPDATAPAPAQRGSGGSAAVLAVEHAAALTCVLLDGPSSLLAAGALAALALQQSCFAATNTSREPRGRACWHAGAGMPSRRAPLLCPTPALLARSA